ncbi:MAG: AarF/ABC1/UbiB kinase family protein [Candidatus Marsarchaeota archaeon]|nr:AarF/ABC1/UbiB kinase family protein [Candidatus Marsarchaeota archaeon]
MRKSGIRKGSVATRFKRIAKMSTLTARVAGTYLTFKSKTIFSNASRKEELNREFEIKSATQVVETLGQMRGVMMKLGQMAGYLDNGIPDNVKATLGTLYNSVPPMTRQLAERTIEAELGAPLDSVFASFDLDPIAAASVGQVHRAITRSGNAVAVKVQYPDAASTMTADLANTDAMSRIIGLAFPNIDTRRVVSEIRERMLEELDYEIEARNQLLFYNYYRGHPFIHIPRIHPELSNKRLLVTELVTGSSFEDALTWSAQERNLAAETIYRFVFGSLYRIAAFNGDPHPGNYIFHKAGRVTFLDFGLTKVFKPEHLNVFESMIKTILIEPNPDKFRKVIESAGLIPPDSPLATSEIVEYFEHFYAFLTSEEEVELSSEFASAIFRHTFDVSSRISRYIDVPEYFVIIQRINLGLYALLARLEATANWRKIAEEIWTFVQGPPATPMGELEQKWLRDTGKRV